MRSAGDEDARRLALLSRIVTVLFVFLFFLRPFLVFLFRRPHPIIKIPTLLLFPQQYVYLQNRPSYRNIQLHHHRC